MNSVSSPGATKEGICPDRTQICPRESQVLWERSSCSIQDYTLQTNSRRLPSIICKDNRCTLNIRENALKMFWPKKFLLIRKGGKLPKAYRNSTFQPTYKYRFSSYWIYVENIYFTYLKKNYYPIFYWIDYVYLQYISNMEK